MKHATIYGYFHRKGFEPHSEEWCFSEVYDPATVQVVGGGGLYRILVPVPRAEEERGLVGTIGAEKVTVEPLDERSAS